MHWPQTAATKYHAQLGLPDKVRAIIVQELVVCNNWDIEPLDLLNGHALGCYQPPPEVLIVLLNINKDSEKRINSERKGLKDKNTYLHLSSFL